MNGTSPPSSAKDIRPGVAFRIGIVGHRQIADEQSIISATSTVIAAVGKELASIAEAPEIACRYRISDRQVGTIHVMSGLAEGADQICALAALAEHDPRKFSVQLTAVLPCDANTFAAGFSGSQANRWREMFTQVLNRARGSFVLDGDPSRTDFTLAYEAVARTIVLNSDLLLAVWNGKDGGGWGGTQSSVQLALDRHVPVLWVRMSEASSGSDAEFSLVASRSDLSLAFDRQQSQASSLNAVRHLVRRTIVFPIAPEEQAPSHLKSTPPITAWIERVPPSLSGRMDRNPP